jgi:hypothetical protein
MRAPSRSSLLLCVSALAGFLVGCVSPRSAHDGAPSPSELLELARLSEYPTPTLVACLSLEYANRHFERTSEVDVSYEITDELRRRPGDVQILVEAFATPADSFQQRCVTEVLRTIDDPAVLEAFTRHRCAETDEVSYYCLKYRAQRGDRKALRILNDNYRQYPVSSCEWAETAALFGQFGYEPAIPNLIGSLDAASLNLACAACSSLEKLFPGPHPDLKGPTEAREYLQKRHEEKRGG